MIIIKLKVAVTSSGRCGAIRRLIWGWAVASRVPAMSYFLSLTWVNNILKRYFLCVMCSNKECFKGAKLEARRPVLAIH